MYYEEEYKIKISGIGKTAHKSKWLDLKINKNDYISPVEKIGFFYKTRSNFLFT